MSAVAQHPTATTPALMRAWRILVVQPFEKTKIFHGRYAASAKTTIRDLHQRYPQAELILEASQWVMVDTDGNPTDRPVARPETTSHA